ncbi:hypothetical protein BH10ACT11_BH10ACT11_02190 [soil metagenome]
MILALLAATATISLVGGCGSGGDGSSTGTTSTPGDPPPHSFYGVVPQDILAESDYPKMQAAGVGTLRVGLYWPQVQPENPYEFDFSRFDATVAAAAKRNMTVFPFLYGAPDWAARTIDKNDCTTDCQFYGPASPASLAFWQAFAAKAAARYGPGGEFWRKNPSVPKKPIRTWQIWNEQNSKTFFLPKPDPKKYEPLLSAAATGLRSVDPDATIVLGGMFGTPGGDDPPDPQHAIAAATFIDDLLKIKGAKSEFDGYALHPYSGSVDFVRKQVEIARRTLSRSGYPNASLWVSEVGWASGGKKSALNVGSEEAQAQRVTQVFKLFEEHRKDWNVHLVAWYAWEDSHASDDFCLFCAKAGLVDAKGDPKPAYDAYKKVTGGG